MSHKDSDSAIDSHLAKKTPPAPEAKATSGKGLDNRQIAKLSVGGFLGCCMLAAAALWGLSGYLDSGDGRETIPGLDQHELAFFDETERIYAARGSL